MLLRPAAPARVLPTLASRPSRKDSARPSSWAAASCTRTRTNPLHDFHGARACACVCPPGWVRSLIDARPQSLVLILPRHAPPCCVLRVAFRFVLLCFFFACGATSTAAGTSLTLWLFEKTRTSRGCREKETTSTASWTRARKRQESRCARLAVPHPVVVSFARDCGSPDTARKIHQYIA